MPSRQEQLERQDAAVTSLPSSSFRAEAALGALGAAMVAVANRAATRAMNFIFAVIVRQVKYDFGTWFLCLCGLTFDEREERKESDEVELRGTLYTCSTTCLP